MCEAALEAKLPLVIDTEFVRVTTYYPQLGLVQFGFGDKFYIIDPLKDIELDSFIDLLRHEDLLKILHSSQQDIEIFHNFFNCIPKPLFDTQVAARFLGFGLSVSYESLVNHYCGETLDKASQFTNWLKRPLTQRQLDYAIHDVRYLDEICRLILEGLEEKGYEKWALEEMKALQKVSLYEVDPEEVWRRVKFTSHNKVYLANLKAVAQVREELAQEWDKPRSHIMKDDLLSEVALKTPKSQEELLKCGKVSKELKASGELERFLKALKKVEGDDPETFPELSKWKKLSESDKRKIKEIKKILTEAAEETGIAASMIARAKDIEAFVRDPEAEAYFMKGWRFEVFGKKLESIREELL